MKKLYLDCFMGAAGDMLCAALLGLIPNPTGFVSEFNGLGISGVEMQVSSTETCGICGLHVKMLVHGHCENEEHHRHQASHSHSGLTEISQIISSLPLSNEVRKNALDVYNLIADAEAKAHGKPVTEVHFHELGALDAIADITAVCMLMERLSPVEIHASPVHVGSGLVHCAHGVLPVPAPATAELLKGIPSYGGEIVGELCTPTGAALLRHFVTSFGAQPEMTVSEIGYGIGTKVFPVANCVRAFLGEDKIEIGSIDEISCNLDDMTGEAIGFALEILLENGALDAYTVPINMKKSRPGVLLRCISRLADTDRLADLILRHTSSLGVRIVTSRRRTIEREISTIKTLYGDVRMKTAGGITKPEYEDLAKIARDHDLTLREAADLISED